MKTKYLIICLAAGAAFLGVTLWAFLTNGKSARAVRAKYKVGGLLLTSWAMFSAASCEGPFRVTCYEPAVMCYDVPAQTDIISVSVKNAEGTRLKPGDVLVTGITAPTYPDYRIRITASTELAPLIQAETFSAPADTAQFSHEMKLNPTSYKGEAAVIVAGITKDSEGNEKEFVVGGSSITII